MAQPDSNPPMEPHCPICGVALGSDAPSGLCPRCLLKEALATEEDGSASDPSLESSVPSERLGDYELLEQVGRGGMGVVYRARQIDLDRIAAIKMLLLGQLASDEMVQRFKREAQSAARLRHPHIVAIHEVGEVEGQPFFSMDFVQGKDLAQIVRESPLPARRAATYLRAVAEAIHYAHQQGIIHRDLKPSNILIDFATDEVRVTDFGLAKRMNDDSDLTLSGQVLGSPNHMAPELAAGHHRLASPASDVFSLGAILYDLLTGRPPFLADSLQATLLKIRDTEPVAPRELNAGIPRDLETICLKCLEKEPGARFGSAQELADELGRFLKGEPIRTRPISAWERTWRWCRRKPALAGLAGAMVVLAVVSTATAIGLGVTRQRLQRERDEAQALAYASDMFRASEALGNNRIYEARNLLEANRPGPRRREQPNWEWRFLWSQVKGQELRTVGTFGEKVNGLALNSGGDIITMTRFGEVRLWELGTGKVLASNKLAGHCMDMAVSADGKMLAVLDGPGVTLLDANSLTSQGTLVFSNTAWTSYLELSPDGRWLTAQVSSEHGQDRFRLVTVDLTRRREVGWTEPGYERLHDIAFSPDSRLVADVASGGQVVLWRVPDLSLVRRLGKPRGQGQICDFVFSPDGKQLIAFWRDGLVECLDVESGQTLGSVDVGPWGGYAMALSPGGETLACLSNGQIYVLDTRPLKLRGTLRANRPQFNAILFSADGNRLFTGQDQIKVYDPRAARLSEASEIMMVGENAALSPDGRYVAWAAAGSETGELMEVGRTQVVARFPFPSQARIQGISPDGRQVAGTDASGTIHVVDTKTSQLRSYRGPTTNGVDRMRFAPHGGRLLTVSKLKDGRSELTLWDVALSAPITQVAQDGAGVECETFSPDGTVVVAGLGVAKSSGARFWLWDIQAGHDIIYETGGKQNVYGVCFLPDGRTLVIGHQMGQIQFWDLGSRPPRLVRSGSAGAGIWNLACSSDGERLFAHGSVTLSTISVYSGREVGDFKALPGPREVNFAAHPDGRLVVRLSGGKFELWRAPSFAEIEAAEKTMATNPQE